MRKSTLSQSPEQQTPTVDQQQEPSAISRRKSWFIGKLSTLSLGAFLVFSGPNGCTSEEEPKVEAEVSPMEQARKNLAAYMQKGGSTDTLEYRRLQYEIAHLQWLEQQKEARSNAQEYNSQAIEAVQSVSNHENSESYNTDAGRLEARRLRQVMEQAQRDAAQYSATLTSINDREPMEPFSRPRLELPNGEKGTEANLYTGAITATAVASHIIEIEHEDGYEYSLVDAPANLGVNSSDTFLVVPSMQTLLPGTYRFTLRKTKPGKVNSRGEEMHYEDSEIVLHIHENTRPLTPEFVGSRSTDMILYSSEDLHAAQRPRDIARIQLQENMRITVTGLPDKLQYNQETGAIQLKPGEVLTLDARRARMNFTITVTEVQGTDGRRSYNGSITIMRPRPATTPTLVGSGGTNFTISQSGMARLRTGSLPIAEITPQPAQNYRLQAQNETGIDVSDLFELVNDQSVRIKQGATLTAGMRYNLVISTNIIQANGSNGPTSFRRTLALTVNVPGALIDPPVPSLTHGSSRALDIGSSVPENTLLTQIRETPGIMHEAFVFGGSAPRNSVAISGNRVIVSPGHTLPIGSHTIRIIAIHISGGRSHTDFTLVIR